MTHPPPLPAGMTSQSTPQRSSDQRRLSLPKELTSGCYCAGTVSVFFDGR
jgi:hypothetical protein